MSSRLLKAGVAALVVVLAAVAAVVVLNLRDEPAGAGDDSTPFKPEADAVARGAYLARAGNCEACHTARGGAAYAGGAGIETPFGVVYASNLTPDAETGLGRWSATQFWRAMHNGRSRDGRLLYPAFPYPNFTYITRTDSDALYAYLRSVPPVRQPNRAHALPFPYNWQVSLAVWRALFFRPGAYEPDTTRSAEWNRGGYLVRGLGHCNACHASRNIFGATSGRLELGGGLIPMQKWYAPSLASSQEAGVADWDVREVVGLLKDGIAPRASVQGPMAEVVYRSTQYLSNEDLRAMAVFLQQLPQTAPVSYGIIKRDPGLMQRGAKLYEQHCAECHGDQGEGAPGAYPPLAGNRAVTMDPPANLIRVLLSGGYPPSTAGNPRPFGMPPFGPAMDDVEVAAVVSYIRNSWGNRAEFVSPVEVSRYRAAPLD
jgi:mono/diheme cytochrome c family protein